MWLGDDCLFQKFHHVQTHLLTFNKFVLPEEKESNGCSRKIKNKPEQLHDLLPHLVKLVLNVVRQLSAKALHPWKVLLATFAPATKLETLVELLLPLLQWEAEVVDPIVVGDLLASLD